MDIQRTPKNTAHRFAKIIVMLALTIFVLLCLWLVTFFTAEKVTQMPFSNITLSSVQRGSFTDTLVTRAIAIPNESVIIASKQGGSVTVLRDAAFSEIKKGDVIAKLANEAFVLQVTSRVADAAEQSNNLYNIRRLLTKDRLDTCLAQQDAHYQAEKRHKEVIRKKILYQRGIMEKATYEQLLDELTYWNNRDAILKRYQDSQTNILLSQLAEIELSLKRLQKLIQQIENGLDELTITAPINGTLSPLTIKIGQQIKPGDTIANVDNPESYYFEASFSEYYLDKIKLYDSVTAQYAGSDIPLIITSISSVVDNGKFVVKLALSQAQPLSLKRGQSVELHVSFTSTADTLYLPSDAVFREQQSTWVYLYDEKRQHAVKTPIAIKRQGETQSEVVSGISVGQQVVVFNDRYIDKSNIIEFK